MEQREDLVDMRQIFKYPGSKWGLSEWIISLFPEHHSYLESYFGSGAVLFNKQLMTEKLVLQILRN